MKEIHFYKRGKSYIFPYISIGNDYNINKNINFDKFNII